MTRKLGVLIFPGFQILDAAGPIAAFEIAARYVPGTYDLRVMALEPGLKATAGASGAIYGLLGALLVVVLKLKLPATTVIAVIVINVVLSLSIPGISLLGHLGGLVFGSAAAAAVIWLPVKILPPEKQTYQQVTKIGWYGLTALAVIALVIGTSFAVEASLG